MITILNNDYLNKSRNFLANQFDTYQWEIDSITRIIQEHQSIKKELRNNYLSPVEIKEELREWRKISFQLHRRRTELRTIKNKLFSQIHEVEKAIKNSRQFM